MKDGTNTLNDLIARVRGSRSSEFYRSAWGTATRYDDLPLMTRDQILKTPLSKRRYVDEGGLTKIVRSERGAFLSEWSFGSIGAQEFGIASHRPMAYFTDAYESLEKAAWCREHGMLAVAGERTPETSRYVAEKYGIDSLIVDQATLSQMMPYLASRSAPLSSISVIGDAFDTHALGPYARFARTIRLVLALPETGALATALYTDNVHFSPVPHVYAQVEHGSLIVTQLLDLVTPIVKYDTRIPASFEAGRITIPQ